MLQASLDAGRPPKPPPGNLMSNAMVRLAYEDPTYDARMYVERAGRPQRIGPDNPYVDYLEIQKQHEVDFPRETEEPTEAPRRLRRNRRVLD